jgi:methyl-accepting chemotaxis protein
LELITQVHPWVGTTIKGASFAYSTTKHYSPRIVQYGANLVERSIAIPVASAVGSVGEYTGVDHTVRRYLDANRPNDVEQGRLDGNESMSMDMDSRLHSRKLSIDSLTEPLPVYGATRPPSYREEQSPASVARFSQNLQGRQKPIRSWSSGLFVTSSGLSVALSTTSRQSLRFCLQLLSTSALRVSEFTSALKSILEQYEQHRQGWRENQDSSLEQGNGHRTPDQDLAIRQLADQIKMQSENIMKTLQHVVNNISEYAGGALPENARNFVRTQLMSLPQRWRVASGEQTAAGSETSKSAQRMIGFAKEGLEMITQVSGVMNATLESAEKWLERVGRRDEIAPADEPMEDAEPSQPAQYDHCDIHKT